MTPLIVLERGELLCWLLVAVLAGVNAGFILGAWYIAALRRRRRIRRVAPLPAAPGLSKVELRAAGARPLPAAERARWN